MIPKATIEEWSKEFGVNHRSLALALRRMDLEIGKGVKFRAKDVATAVFGDYRSEKARLTRAQADIKEQQARLQSREMVRLDEAEAMIRSALQPVRELLLSAPSTLAARCNPVDPTIARTAVTAWVDEGLRVCRGEALGEAVKETPSKPKRKREK